MHKSKPSGLQDHALSTGHPRALWGVTTVVVIGYSYLLSTMLPFFSELVRTFTLCPCCTGT